LFLFITSIIFLLKNTKKNTITGAKKEMFIGS